MPGEFKEKKKYKDFPKEWKNLNGVFVHPHDERKFPHPVTKVTPEEFSCHGDPTGGHWGFVNDSGVVEGSMEAFMQNTNFANADLFMYTDHAPPIEQYVQCLVKKKAEGITCQPVAGVLDRMLVVRITMPQVDDKLFYRVVELPASVSLAVLHDKILSAVMGWCRGYHGYVFIDMKDKSVLGPKKNSGYIDMMHAISSYYAIGDDRKFPLASLLTRVGDACEYIYDLGDQYKHRIELLEIKDKDYAPVRNVTILDGQGSCPPEDGNGLDGKGNKSFMDFLMKYKANPKACAKQVRSIEATAINYAKHWCGPVKFLPLDFDRSLHQKMLEVMVAGPNCVLLSSFNSVSTYSACNNCGESLSPLLTCAGCRSVKYCSKECQRLDWKEGGHKEECADLKEQKLSPVGLS
jgi:hypothetical protein